MADRTPRNPAPTSPVDRAPAPPAPALAAQAPMILEDDPDPPPFDAHGFDPAEFEWRPVPRRARTDGWTPEVQQAFIQALADTGLVEHAARAVDMSVQSAYRLRRAVGSEGFAQAWLAALAAAAERVLDLAFKRAIEGEDTPVFDSDGRRIGARWRTNDRLTMFILRAYMPDRFARAHEDGRARAESPSPLALPVAEAIAALAPVVPDAPHLLMEPDRLEGAVQTARAVGEVHQRYPRDDRQRYVHPRVEEDHPATVARSLARRRREMARPDLDDWLDEEDNDQGMTIAPFLP